MNEKASPLSMGPKIQKMRNEKKFKTKNLERKGNILPLLPPPPLRPRPKPQRSREQSIFRHS